ncbi:helix-turn-helix transcriptional regulator [Flavobacterium sp. CHNK8]|uniref:helix-turn-helix domain-containing protein n=1 Tax=Flavobacterium sp. CHNK8 TaxID=2871165 RepID=UPI001C8D0CF9|nr:helix-turn-helix transcriptional regulator [Flavobacterium sp. CHNK8]QZK89304.1 helix-turn-helix transcriptional regulator [Flavobacterium sp. CHNK8]
MKTKIVYPKNPLLKKFIQYFLFLTKGDTEMVSQLCYPNTNHCLSLIKGGEMIALNANEYSILPSTRNSSYLTGIYKEPIKIIAKQPYQELCINFNPLGLEAIFGEQLSQNIFKNNILSENKNWNPLFEIVFSNDSLELIQNEIESFFISILRDEMLSNSLLFNETVRANEIEDLNDLLCKSYRSTHRYFVNQLQTTPKEYLQIKKVREAMSLILKNVPLIEIAFLLNFTDQSHFIKTFKKYTNITPSQFKQSSSQVDNTLIWNLE